MRRLLTTLALLLSATSVFAFDATKGGQRIAILQGTTEAEELIGRSLLRELQKEGLDAFEAGQTWDELLDQEPVPIADYIIELRGGETRTADYGGIDVAGRHADVSLGVVVSKLGAELRVYDGATMTLIASSDLSKRSAALMPMSIGIGGDSIFAYVALPFIERAQHRSVARKAARAAAQFVVATVRGE